MSPLRARGFAESEIPSNFFSEYVRLVRTEGDPGKVGVWLLANGKYMSEEMFLDPSTELSGLEPHHMVAMRATAPARVFTTTAKGGYLTCVARNPALKAIADVLFADDYTFITSLPGEYSGAQRFLVQLMQLAYRQGIRPADGRVKSM